MNLESGFLAVMQRLGTIMPAAVQTAEVLGTALTPGQQVGERKFAAVLQVGMQLAGDAAAAAGIMLPDAAALSTAVGDLIQSHVSMMKLFQSQTAATPAAASEPSTQVAGSEGVYAAGVATPVADEPASLSTPPLPGEQYRQVGDVRYVWDAQSGRWASAGR
jgi:hypothetical protein